jgi:hypothetical protein
MGSVVVVVLAEGVELELEDGQGGGRNLLAEVALKGLVETLDLATGLGVVGLECLDSMPRRSSSDSSTTRPFRGAPLKTAALSLRNLAGKPWLSAAE